jgi:hypothetical protein
MSSAMDLPSIIVAVDSQSTRKTTKVHQNNKSLAQDAQQQ